MIDRANFHCRATVIPATILANVKNRRVAAALVQRFGLLAALAPLACGGGTDGTGDGAADADAADVGADKADVAEAGGGAESGWRRRGGDVVGRSADSPGTPDLSTDTAAMPDLGSDLPTEQAPPVDAADAGSQADGPPGSDAASPAGAQRLLPARSQLLGLHGSACNYGPASNGAGAARWCAVSRPGAILGTLELWVLNVTAARANPAAPRCQTSNTADCIKLTSNLFASQPEGGPAFPTAHRFHGDTLIYYANAVSAPSELYKGPVFAWKPGWTEGRQIASSNGVLCSGHSRADVAVCIENISALGVEPMTWDVHAGRIDAGPMKKVAQIIPVHPQTEASQWGSGFTATGDYFTFSTPTAATGMRETLFFIRTDRNRDRDAYPGRGPACPAGRCRPTAASGIT